MTNARRASLIAGVVFAVGAVLAGCGSQHAGTAAIIDGQRITETSLQNDVNAALTEISSTSSSSGSSSSVSGGTVAQNVLQFDIQLDFLNRIAGRLGVSVTGTEVAQVRASAVSSLGSLANLTAAMTSAPNLFQQGATLVLPPSELDNYLYADTLLQKVSTYGTLHPSAFTAAYNAALAGMSVTINPRYGSFDPKNLAFASGSTATAPWLRDAPVSG